MNGKFNLNTLDISYFFYYQFDEEAYQFDIWTGIIRKLYVDKLHNDTKRE